MANKTKLLGCKVPQPAEQVRDQDGKPAVCDRRPGHKGPHRHRGMKVQRQALLVRQSLRRAHEREVRRLARLLFEAWDPRLSRPFEALARAMLRW
jgi:hypothetical protein